MCDLCARLAAETDLADLTVQVIGLEAAAGLSWPGAARPLHDHELRAQVRFADLDRLGADTAALIARHADGVRQQTITALLADLRALGATDGFAILARLQALASPAAGTALPLRGVLDQAGRDILASLVAARGSAAAGLLDEARRQGVASAVLPDDRTLRPTTADRQALETLARQVAEAPLTRILDVATREARAGLTRATHPDAVISAVSSAVDAISTAGVEDLARQATTTAVNQGRLAAAQKTPDPQEVYASELLDKNTCVPCSQLDGRLYESLDAALVDYPSGGSYAGCLGGPRCRGTLVFVWDTESAPTLDQSPGDPSHPIDRQPQPPALPGEEAPDETDDEDEEPIVPRVLTDDTEKRARFAPGPAGDALFDASKHVVEVGPHTITSEVALTRKQLDALAGDVARVVNAVDGMPPVLYRIPKKDRTFGPKSSVGGYVWSGDSTTVHINPKAARGDWNLDGIIDGNKNHFMPGWATERNPRLWIIAHETGHIMDHYADHTKDPNAGLWWTKNKQDLGNYGQSSRQEGYAEAFADWLLGSSQTGIDYGKEYGWTRHNHAPPASGTA